MKKTAITASAAELKKLHARIRRLERSEKTLNLELGKLRESENIYRAIFNNTGTITLIFDENTIIRMVNSDFAKRMVCCPAWDCPSRTG